MMPAPHGTSDTATGWFVGIVAALAILSVGYLVYSASPPKAAEIATAFVKVVDDKGHGSGVHIGSGYILTAAHVANDFKDMTIVDTLGVKRTAKTLWQNVSEDVALMRVDGFDGIGVAELDCSPTHDGQRITAIGNPRDLEDITMSGRVAGVTRKIGPWAHGVPVDMTILPGMSGGAVIDEAGSVVGISVGAMNLGTSAFDGDMVGLGIVVPASTICALMGRN
jgi:serine protease Do